MTKDEKIQIACSTIQSAIILDLFANVTDDTKKLITKQLSDIYEMGEAAGFVRASDIARSDWGF